MNKRLKHNVIIEFLSDEGYRRLLFVSGLIITIGSIFYHNVEGWSWIDSAYFSVITLTTIGYGDFSPQTDEGKIFTMLYVIVGLGMILGFVNTVYEHYNKRNVRRQKNRTLPKEGPTQDKR